MAPPKHSASPDARGARRRVRRFSGRGVVAVGIVLVLLVSSYVVIRILQVSGPGPDPSTIPERPSSEP